MMRTNEINLRLLVEAVSKRPALYDKSHLYYFNTKYKQRLWRQACQEVFPHWELMQPHSKMKRLRAIQKRWKNLRTCFTRELALQKKEERERNEGRIVKPRKIYGYFNKLSFLLLKDQQRREESENYEQNETNDLVVTNFKTEFLDDDFEDYEELEVDEELKDEQEVEGDESEKIGEPEQFLRVSEEVGNVDRIVNSRETINGYEEIDEDKHFLLSLVNTLRKFNDKQKIEAKIEILRALKKIQFAGE